MSSIFLSHSSSDDEFVRELATDLRDLGATVWVDEAEIRVGDSLLSKIEEGIAGSEYLGVVISNSSITSEWVQREVRIALSEEIAGRRVKVLPLLIEDVEIPGFLRDKLFLDFREKESYETQLAGLADRLSLTSQLPSPRTIRDLLIEGMEAIEKHCETAEMPGHSFGFPDLDDLGVRARPGSVISLAAWDHGAASILATSLARNVAVGGRGRVVTMTGKGSGSDLFYRIVAGESHVPISRMTSGMLHEKHWQRISLALTRLADSKWTFVDEPPMSPDDLARFLRREARRKGPAALVVLDDVTDVMDYGVGSGGALGRDLARIALEMESCLLVVTDLDEAARRLRDVPELDDVRPRELSRHSSVVLLISRESEDHFVEVAVGRNAYGHIGRFELVYVDPYRKFVPPSPPPSQPSPLEDP